MAVETSTKAPKATQDVFEVGDVSTPSGPALAEGGATRAEIFVDARVLELDVEGWVDADPQVEIWMRRTSDGLVMVFAPSKESYTRLVAQGVVAFTPAELKAILAARSSALHDPEKERALRELLARVVEVKRALPGTKLKDVLDLEGGQ